MKFHLPRKLFVAVMAAVVSTQVFAEETEPVTFDNSVAGVANVTIIGGDLSKYYMFGSYLNVPAAYGVVGPATCRDTVDNAPIEKFTSATITMKDGYGLKYLSGYGIGGNIIETDVTINMEGGEVQTIVGGTHFASKANRDRNKYGTDPGYGHTSFGYKSNYGNEDDSNSPKQNIIINVSGGKVGQIRGTHNGHSNSSIYITYLPAVIKAGEDAIAEFMKSNPVAASGDVKISITGGLLDATWVGETFAIQGGGGTGFSVDGTVYIAIQDTDNTSPTIKGDILAGSSNVYTFVGGTDVTIDGGTITGSVYGGGAGHETAKIAGGPAPTVNGSTRITLSGGTITEGNVYGAGLKDIVKGSTNVTIANKGTAVEGTIFGGGIESSVERDRVLTVDSSYNGDKSYKVADFTDIAVNADVTFETLTGAEEGTAVEIAEGATMTVTGEGSAASVIGGKLVLDGSSFELTGDTLSSDVVLDNHAELNLNGANATNTIWVYGCTLSGAENFEGELIVDGGELNLAGSTCADSVIITNGGSVTGSSLATKALTIDTTNTTAGETVLDTDLTIHKGGELALKGGETLVITGSLTMEEGATISLSDDYEYGDEAIIVESGDMTYEDGVTLRFGNVVLEVQDNVLVVMSQFDQDVADTLSLSNWGIATASRTFVNTVRGQRTNTGCIAGGKGTAWAAVLGGNHDINGSDINLKGAAVGADMKVGSAGSVGVAFGYIEGDVKPSGLSDVDQEGTYVALYGEHGLKKLSSTSCLSLDWVAAYGNTESDAEGTDWEQDSLQLNTRLNWNRKVTDRLCMSVFGGLEYFTSESDTVDGVKTGSLQNLRGEIGVGARYVAWGTPGTAASYDEKGAMVTESRPGCEKLVLHGEVRYMNDMVRSNPVIRMEGMSGGSDNPGRQGMGIEAGATYRIGERWSASANYGFNTMDDSREHRVNVGAAYTF